jgi:predicted pyridoxine 5'-phosphate oxidase superfamily flavin-nucleotide-binding protein
MTKAVISCLEQSVLCWLATASKENYPNVSPKEVFAVYENRSIIIANIASPQSVKNIRTNPKVCLSVIDILIQKGYQLKGNASIVSKNEDGFADMASCLLKLTGGKFPFSEIIRIEVHQSMPIVAPKYVLYPDTTEAAQIASAKKAYGF